MSLISRPMIKTAHQVHSQNIQTEDGLSYTRITNVPDFSSDALKSSCIHDAIKTADEHPIFGEIRNTYSVDPVTSAKWDAVPSFIGNHMASNVSGETSPIKALLSIVAGLGLGIGARHGIANFAPSMATSVPGVLGTTAAAAGGGSYLTRRVLDHWKDAEKEASENDRPSISDAVAGSIGKPGGPTIVNSGKVNIFM